MSVSSGSVMCSRPTRLSSTAPDQSDLSPVERRRKRPSPNFHLRVEGGPGLISRTRVIAPEQRVAATREDAEQLVERIGKLLHSIHNQLCRDLIQRDTMLLQCSQHRASVRHLLFYAVGLCLAMIPKRIHRRRWDRVYG